MSNVEEGKASEPPVVQQSQDPPVKVAREVQVQPSSWSGPLPAPADLQRLEEIAPGAANRILTISEKQADHRIDMERTLVNHALKRGHWGLVAGFVLSAMVILGGIFLISGGHDWAGGILISMNLVGLASVFVYGSNSRRSHRQDRIETLSENAALDGENRRSQRP